MRAKKNEALDDELKNLSDIITLVQESSDSETKPINLAKCLGTFKVIFAEITATPDHAYEQKVATLTRSYLKECLLDVFGIVKQDDVANTMNEILITIVKSPVAAHVAKDVAHLVTTFLFCNFKSFPNYIQFFPFLEEFFRDPVFVPAFQQEKGPESCLNLFIDTTKSEFTELVIENMKPTLSLYYRESPKQLNDFLNLVLQFITSVTTQVLPYYLSFLLNLLRGRDPKVIDGFIKDKFDKINQVIYAGKAKDMLRVYSAFTEISNLNCEDDQSSLLIEKLVDLIGMSKDDGEFQLDVLRLLYDLVTGFKIGIGTSDYFRLSRDDIDPANFDNVEILFELCLFAAGNMPRTDKNVILETIRSFVTLEAALERDISTAFEVIQLAKEAFSRFAMPFFTLLIKPATSEDLTQLFHKYPILIELFPTAFRAGSNSEMEVTLIRIFLGTTLWETDYETFHEVLCVLFERIPRLFPFIIPQLSEISKGALKALLQVVTDVAIRDADARKSWIGEHVMVQMASLTESGCISVEQLFDFIASLAFPRINYQGIDKEVFLLLEKHNFFNASEMELRKLAFGRRQSDEEGKAKWRLALPSLLPKLQSFVIASPFDQIYCSRVGINAWLAATGRHILEFPSLDRVSKRMVRLSHAKFIIQQSKLMLQCFGSDLDTVPLFEFPERVDNSEITIACEGVAAMSLWFWIDEPAATYQTLVTYGSVDIGFNGLNVIVGGEVAFDFRVSRWNLIVILPEGVMCNNQTHPWKIGNDVPIIVLGNRRANVVDFYIGGAVRVFSAPLQQKTIDKIWRNGAKFLSVVSRDKEILTLEPSDTNHPDVIKFGENSRIATASPFSSYIQTAMGGSTHVFERIMSLIMDEDTERAIDLVHLLVRARRKEISSWNTKEFAIHMSIFANYGLVDDALAQAFFDCLVSTNDMEYVFDWEAALTFLLDFRLLSSTTTVTNMKWFMDCSAVTETHKLILARFVFHAFRVLRIPSLDELFKALDPPMSLVCELLAFLKTHESGEETKQLLRRSFNSMLTKDFEYWYVLSALPDTEALEEVQVVISLLSSADDWSKIDRKRLMKECVTRCHLTKAWSSAISLMIRSPIDIESRAILDINTIDVSLVPDFLVMFGILAGQIHRADPKSRWKRIFDTSLSFLKDIWEYVVVDDTLVFSLIHVLGMATYTENVCVFPFSPGLKDPGDVIEYALQRGQPFPEATSSEQKKESDDRDQLDKAAVIAECEKLVPHSFHMIPPFSETILTHHISEIEYEEMIQTTQSGLYRNFMDFCRQKAADFEFEQPETVEERLGKLETSILTIEVFQFVVDFLLDREDKLVSYLSRLAVHSQLNDSHYTVFMFQKIIFFILHHYNTEGIYSEVFADFVCERISEGWFSGQIAPVLALLMGACTSAINDKMVQTLLLGFDLIPFSQFHIFTELFVTYQSIIFVDRDLEFYKILLHNVWKHYDVAPETFTKILNIIVGHLESLKEDPGSEMLEYVIGSIRGEEHNEDHLKEFKNSCFDSHEEFERECRNVILASLNELSKQMQDNEEFFYKEARNYGKSILQDRVTMRTATHAVAKFAERVHECDIEAFFRIREQMLTKAYRFDHNKGTGRALVPLTDVFLPSRRMERSPLLYKVKDLPRKIIPRPYKIAKLDILSDVNEKVTLNMQAIDTILFSKYQVPKLRFCCVVPIPEDLSNQLFDAIVGNGAVGDKRACSFRSCSHQCVVTGTLYTLPDSLVFRDDGKSLAKVPKHFFMNYLASGFFGKPSLYKGTPVLTWSLTEIVKIFKISSTVFEFNLAGGQSFILEGEIDDIVAPIVNNTLPLHNPTLRVTKYEMSACIEKWQKGIIDNYSYLCYLNRMAGRSFADSGCYPVFPFMFSNGDEFRVRDLSLPMGMLDEDKAKYYKDQYEISGVHYKDGFLDEGRVVSYLSNVDPFAIFSLQSKPLDLSSALVSSDFIAEMVPHWFGFTAITEGITLPKWAKSPMHFSHCLLESLQDSEKLHLWIDLIFGCKSRGEAAIEAMNVFSSDKVTSEQLFKKLHEPRTPTTQHEIFFNANFITMQELVGFDRPVTSFLVSDEDVIGLSSIMTHVHGNVFLRLEKNRRRLVCVADDKRTTVFSSDFLRTTNSVHLSSNGMFLIMSQTEGSICIARVLYNAGIPESLVDLVRFPTNAQVRDTAISSTDFLAIAVCGNRIRRFCLARMREIDAIDAEEKINSVCIDEANGVIVIGCEKSFVIYTIGGKPVWVQQCGSPVSAVHCANIRKTLYIATGHVDGYVLLWYYDTSMSMVVNCFASKVLKSNVRVIAQNPTGERIICGNNEQLASLDFKGTSLPPVHRKLVVNCAKCGKKILKRRNCVECKRHFCNKCVTSYGKKMPHLKRHICEFCAKKTPQH